MTWDWHHLEFAQASGLFHIATDLVKLNALTLRAYMPYMNEPVWHTKSLWFMLKSVHWLQGQLQDYSTKECINVRDYSPVGSAIAESWNKYVHMIKWKEAQMDDSHSLLQPEG